MRQLAARGADEPGMAHGDGSRASTAPALTVRSRNSGGRRAGLGAALQHHHFRDLNSEGEGVLCAGCL